MSFESIEYVYRKGGQEEHYTGVKSGPKWAYFDFVQAACRKSNLTLQNFQTNPAEKFRIYTEPQVQQFSLQKRNSTRIKDQSCLITVSDSVYYVANNLKVCEYFNSAAMNIDSSEKTNWFIRIYFDDSIVQQMEDKEEPQSDKSD